MKGQIDHTLSLGTLAATTLVGSVLTDTMVESGRISSLVATWALKELTEAAGDGPITVGLAHSDYTDAEVEETVELTNSWDPGNMITRERANRKVRIIGTFRSAPGGGGGVGTAILNDGRPIKTKLNWGLTTGDTLRIWAYNEGSSALASTVPNLHVIGHANLFVKL